MGPSAVGKTEVAKVLIKLYNISKVVTYTTRDKRINEVDGVDYHFVTKDEFLHLKKHNFFVETTLYNNNYYGTSKKEIKDNKLLIVDPSGKDAFLKLKKHYVVVFYLQANEELRKKRMKERGDSPSIILQRLTKDKKYFSEEAKIGVNYIIDSENKSIEEIAREIYSLYLKTK